MIDPPETPENENKVRSMLRDLPRKTTPWYFEARLQQRLRSAGEVTKDSWFLRPVPAIATLGTLAICSGVVGYLVFLSPSQPVNEISDQPAVSVQPLESWQTNPPLVPETPPSLISGGQPGPNAGDASPAVESGVVPIHNSLNKARPDSILVDSSHTLIDTIGASKRR